MSEARQEGKHRWVTYCHCLISNSPDCLILTDCLLRRQLPLRIVYLEKEEKGNSCVLSSCVCRKVLLCLKASVTELGSKGAQDMSQSIGRLCLQVTDWCVDMVLLQKALVKNRQAETPAN